MADHPQWLDEWPERYRTCLDEKIAGPLGFTAIHKLQNLSGASGAETYLAAPEGPHGRPNLLVIKLGSTAQLEEEVQRHVNAAAYFEGVMPPLQVVECDGVMCVVMLQIKGETHAYTFREYYERTDDPAKIASAIRQLFEKTFRPRSLHAPRVNQSAFSLYTIHDPAQMARELRIAGDRLPTLVDWWFAAARHLEQREGTSGSYTCFAHGDLHASNILVSEGGVYVIDFGHTNTYHVYRDPAKLERDVRIRLLGASLSDSIKHIAALDELDEALKQDGIPENPALRKAYHAIRAIRECARAKAAQSGIAEEKWGLEYSIALLAQCMFAAADPRTDSDRQRVRPAALHAANVLRDIIDNTIGPVPLDRSDERFDVLARFAYAFLRLEQLPSGGWAKSLANWMEGIWAGDGGSITRNPGMRQRGGTDLTCYALCQFIEFTGRILPDRLARSALYQGNRCCQRARDDLASLIGNGGGIGVGMLTQGGGIQEVHLRHTAQAVNAFFRYGEAVDCDPQHKGYLKQTAGYVLNFIELWRRDSSHPFALLCALTKLHELVESGPGERQLEETQRKALLDALVDTLPEIHRARDWFAPNNYDPRPTGTRPYCGPHGFMPYSGFWRMQRSNLLMSLRSLVSEDGEALLPRQSPAGTLQLLAYDIEQLELLLVGELSILLTDVAMPFDLLKPTESLIRYHDPTRVDGDSVEAPRDWALSAELLGMLHVPAIKGLLARHGMSEQVITEKQATLRRALIHLVGAYTGQRSVFAFTHGVALSGCLSLVNQAVLPGTRLQELDQAVTRALEQGVTEYRLSKLVNDYIVADSIHTTNATKGIIELLVSKLESGEYTPDRNLCKPDEWLRQVEHAVDGETIAFYDARGGDDYVGRYGDDLEVNLIEFLDCVMGAKRHDGRRALDVGCGPGQYAGQLADKGFDVVAFDASRKMCELAKQRLGSRVKVFQHNLYHDHGELRPGTFDLVFACAMMVHVPRRRAGEVLRKFYRLLNANGTLFVNFKIGDHSLIARDGRFYEYYRDDGELTRMLADAGFSVEAVVRNRNRRDTYGDPRDICWANFYCRERRDWLDRAHVLRASIGADR